MNRKRPETKDKSAPRWGRNIALAGVATFLFAMVILFVALSKDSVSLERVLYQVALFGMCCGTFLLCRRDSELRLLALFVPFYYLLFGAAELITWFFPLRYVLYEGTEKLRKSGFSDILILLGGISMVAGYLINRAMFPPGGGGWFRREWNETTAYWAGILIWIIGTIALIIVHIVYESTGKTVDMTSLVISNGSYLSLLGGIIMTYLAYTAKANRLVWLTLIAMVGFELILGFAGNWKEISFRLPLIIVISGFLLKGKLRIKLALIIAICFIPYQAAFNIYRTNVIMAKHRTYLEAIESSQRSVEEVQSGVRQDRGMIVRAAIIAVDRVDCRKYIDILVNSLGTKRPYKNGATLAYALYSFVPKMIWPEKPQGTTGQMFNREFGLSASPLTFVPTTLIGDFYWNFGMAGGIIGMFVFGAILSIIGSRCSLDRLPTVGRFLFLLVTVYVFVLRFEDNFAVDVHHFARMAVIIFVLDRIMVNMRLSVPKRRFAGNDLVVRDTRHA